MKNILILEDDDKLRAHLHKALVSEGYLVTQIASISELSYLINNGQGFDLLILDRLIGQEDSKKFIPNLKQKWPSSPILILSAISTSVERTDLLDMGVDDYVGKPFSISEVVARVRALLRRITGPAPVHIVIRNTVVDIVNRHVIVDSRPLVLAAKEFLLLKTMAQTLGRIYNKSELLDTVWSSSPDVETNVVEVTITNLRKRLATHGSEISIKNSRNLGYWIEN
ncbi:MAG: hypothetical protein A2X86_18760 [Bdellovibrionales bacterium GWA2_49_15]|nr:MAG: hypothetical protein A2X86_18760 [Bdellovibrionales bacterium GWA2_49_15]HAZ14268.1 hypothetical protein [Bdellovibrionales bacterium]